MFDPGGIAAAWGLRVEVCDLGDWGTATLISEYDARAGVIRINARAVDAFRRACGGSASSEVGAFIELAIAHEVYHHREATGAVARLPTTAQREAAADAFARSTVSISARLAAFIDPRTHR